MTNEQIAQKLSKDACAAYGVSETGELFPLVYNAILTALQRRDQEHEAQIDAEQARWQDRIDAILISECPDAHIDGSGVDSGNPLDLTACEIRQAFGWLKDQHEAQVARLTKERDNAREDVKRLDWLESASWEHPLSGNGIGIFPCQSAHTGQRYIHLHGLGEEDGSNLGEEITGSSSSLRAAITQAMTGGA